MDGDCQQRASLMKAYVATLTTGRYHVLSATLRASTKLRAWSIEITIDGKFASTPVATHPKSNGKAHAFKARRVSRHSACVSAPVA